MSAVGDCGVLGGELGDPTLGDGGGDEVAFVEHKDEMLVWAFVF